jgi:fatty acid desaturase
MCTITARCDNTTTPTQSTSTIPSRGFDVQGSAIDDAEKAYLSQDDAVALVSMQSSPLRRFLERWPAFRLFRQWRKFVHSPTLKNVQYRDPDKIECFVKLITVSFVLIMLIAPLWVLMYLETTIMKLVVNTVFTAFFLVMLSYVSNARTQEAVAATAG